MCAMLLSANLTIVTGTLLFFAVSVLLVAILLLAKKYLVPTGNVKIKINDDKVVEVPTGGTLLSTLSDQKVFLPSACGGSGSCGQCRVRITEGVGEALPTEKVHFSRKELLDNWHLGCQVKIKNDLSILVPETVLGVKEWECEVLSNKKCSDIYQGVYCRASRRRTHEFHPGLLCANQNSKILDGLR